MAVIRADNISVGYGKVTVAGGITFEVQSGEILTLIGPNGAGKSTVLKSIAAQLPLLSGTAYIGERSISAITEREISRELSLVLTERIHAERMTCRDVVATGRYPYTGRLGTYGSFGAQRQGLPLHQRRTAPVCHACEGNCPTAKGHASGRADFFP